MIHIIDADALVQNRKTLRRPRSSVGLGGLESGGGPASRPDGVEHLRRCTESPRARSPVGSRRIRFFVFSRPFISLLLPLLPGVRPWPTTASSIG
jgi:hypothetical protein